ncbi:carboxypeptidase-like regulatory domain-containing protein [Bacteroides sp.]|uniref:carboxypeptidase-like regulatory domain-containing protein n=1 Tax=Bacteroides sp. TaxID=29523 RepID=UPI002FC794A1
MRFKFLWIILMLLLPIKASSQFVISGSVKNKNNEVVSYANVTLLRQADSLSVNYATTNNEGKFKIEQKEAGKYFLRVSCLGYSAKTIPIIFTDNKIVVSNFVLDESLTELESVVVTGRNPGIRFKNDTIRYDPKVFTDGSEIVLGDVLKKLPGVEVDSKGRVKAQGKQVESILLNGQDFFSGNTQMATKNLPADVAENVEVLNNYSEYSLLGGFQSHEKTVINVGVSNKKMGKISGELTASYGYKDKYIGKASIMQMNSKLMTSFVGALNNTGDEVFNMEEYIRLQGGINELMNNSSSSSIELSKEEQSMLMPQNNTFKRKNLLSALNMAYQPNTSLKCTSYFLFNEINEEAQDIVKYNYLLPDGSLETTKQIDSKGKNRLYSGLWKLSYQPSQTFNLAYKGNISNIDMNRNAMALNSIDKKQINASDIYDAQTLKTRHDVLLMNSLGRHLLAANIYFSYSNKPAAYDMQVDSLLLPIPLIVDNGWYYGQQKTKFKQIESGANLSFMYKINSAYFINSSLNTQISNQRYRSNIYQDIPSQRSIELDADSLRNSIKMDVYDYNAGVSLVKNTGLLRFKLGVFAHIYQFDNNKFASESKVKLNPIAEVSLFFSRKHVLNVAFSESDSPVSASAFLSGIVFDSYQDYMQNSLTQYLYSSKYSANLTYRIYDLFSNTMVVFTSMYSHIKNSSSNDYFQDGLLTKYQPVSTLPKDYFVTKLFVNKGLGFIPWVMKINGGYNYTSFSNQAMGIENKIQAENASALLQLESNYHKQIFNFECKVGLEYFNNKSSLGAESTQHIQRYGGKIKMNINKRLFAAVELEYVINDAPDYKQNQYNLNTNINYVLNKNFEIEIVGVNMLHMDKQDWVATYNNGVYLAERFFRQIPGNLMLKARYKF